METNKTSIEESNIRYECRRKFRSEGVLESDYDKGSKENFIWESEAMTIMLEQDRSI